jgi:hypothetical protein
VVEVVVEGVDVVVVEVVVVGTEVVVVVVGGEVVVVVDGSVVGGTAVGVVVRTVGGVVDIDVLGTAGGAALTSDFATVIVHLSTTKRACPRWTTICTLTLSSRVLEFAATVPTCRNDLPPHRNVPVKCTPCAAESTQMLSTGRF